MDWLDYLSVFYAQHTGCIDDAARARIREEQRLTLAGEVPITISWEPLGRDRLSRPVSRLVDGGYIYYNKPLHVPCDHIYTLVSCPIRRQSCGEFYLWKRKVSCLHCNAHLPVVTVNRLDRCVVSHLPERTDLVQLRLQRDLDSFYDRLIVETPVLRGDGGDFLSALDWHPQDENGLLRSSDETALLLLGQMAKLLVSAYRILNA